MCSELFYKTKNSEKCAKKLLKNNKKWTDKFLKNKKMG